MNEAQTGKTHTATRDEGKFDLRHKVIFNAIIRNQSIPFPLTPVQSGSQVKLDGRFNPATCNSMTQSNSM